MWAIHLAEKHIGGDWSNATSVLNFVSLALPERIMGNRTKTDGETRAGVPDVHRFESCTLALFHFVFGSSLLARGRLAAE